MTEMKVPHFPDDSEQYVYFEPKPRGPIDDSSLEGCMRYASKVEQLIDKNNLYLCEQCTEDKYGKSKNING